MVYANFSLNLPIVLQRFEFAELNKAYLHNGVVICLPACSVKKKLFIYCEFCQHMMTSNGRIFRVTGLLCGEFTGQRWIPLKGQWHGALMFSLICAWINRWVNNREAGDLRGYRTPHYDVNVIDLGSSPPGGKIWWTQQVPIDIHSLVMKNLQMRKLWLIN